ncbi:unnamed protein product [Nesidiocoris tenuis]|uniref:Uncharacterized protein n=1 Tax=Nesidiocoris tenuis TaxID=355587 RepID=A0A6H5G5J2_9HEMI|nr:unnamed protein product [Nesidiocoris tenuis]
MFYSGPTCLGSWWTTFPKLAPPPAGPSSGFSSRRNEQSPAVLLEKPFRNKQQDRRPSIDQLTQLKRFRIETYPTQVPEFELMVFEKSSRHRVVFGIFSKNRLIRGVAPALPREISVRSQARSSEKLRFPTLRRRIPQYSGDVTSGKQERKYGGMTAGRRLRPEKTPAFAFVLKGSAPGGGNRSLFTISSLSYNARLGSSIRRILRTGGPARKNLDNIQEPHSAVVL